MCEHCAEINKARDEAMSRMPGLTAGLIESLMYGGVRTERDARALLEEYVETYIAAYE